ncbi:hypothetical protein LH464_04260 [Neorhizobium sp. T786]|uniref:hypothetical protein n=1 Tax=Pseudorhizobium xiangyangii TaxID=2883104 RepID=UPI001CFF5D6F|nr:hypothetical protein [Neorhizobium xiangyangii]MCB5201691.1 hypothetical protein [Neorhizobium xiangyangii]
MKIEQTREGLRSLLNATEISTEPGHCAAIASNIDPSGTGALLSGESYEEVKARASNAENELRAIRRELVERGFGGDATHLRFAVGLALDSGTPTAALEADRDNWKARAECAEEAVEAVRIVLMSTEHRAEGASVDLLVDAAIDIERERSQAALAAKDREFSDAIQRVQRSLAIAKGRAERAEEVAAARLAHATSLISAVNTMNRHLAKELGAAKIVRL